MNPDRVVRILVPAAVFQSVIVGGAYGTGREVAEYVSQYGPWGGLGATLVSGCGFALILALSLEFARRFRAYEYRAFLKALLGPWWVSYEILFVMLLVIVLAVTGAAAGRVLQEAFGVPVALGTGLMLAGIVATTWSGRRWVELTLAIGAVLVTSAIFGICVAVLAEDGARVFAAFDADPGTSGWIRSGFVFLLYNSALAPVLVYVAAPLRDWRETAAAGVLAGLAGVLPALLLHLAFMRDQATLVAADLPTFRLIGSFDAPWLAVVYVCVLFMTIVQTGVGVLHGVNERIDAAWRERLGAPLPTRLRVLIAGGAVLASLLLAKLGLVRLIAQGYGTLAWGFLAVFTLPLLTRGVLRILTDPSPADEEVVPHGAFADRRRYPAEGVSE